MEKPIILFQSKGIIIFILNCFIIQKSQNYPQSESMLQSPSTNSHKFYRKKSTILNSEKQSSQYIQFDIQKAYSAYCQAQSFKQQVKLLWKVIRLCYNNSKAQTFLSKLLNLPDAAGPISLNPLPGNLLDHNQKLGEEEITQLQFLFDFLKNTQEKYFCWIIYYSEQLKVLNLKLLREDQLQQFEELFNPNLNLIGIFTNKQKIPIKTPQKDHQISDFYQQSNLTKGHVKSTPNNSTGFSWSNLQHQMAQLNSKSSKFKFRSITPKLKAPSKIFNVKKQSSEQISGIKINKSLSILSRVSKSKSSLHKTCPLNNEKTNFASTYCAQSRLNALRIQKTSNGKTKLKKESKIHRIQRIYKKII